MTCCLNKNIYSRSKNWVSLIKSVEIRQKRTVRPYYANLYAYAANNPVRYVDPDGRLSICSFYIPDYCSFVKSSENKLVVPLGGGLSSSQKDISKIQSLSTLGFSLIPDVGSFASIFDSDFSVSTAISLVETVSGMLNDGIGVVTSMIDLMTIIASDPDINAHNYTSSQQEFIAKCSIEQSFIKDFSKALNKHGILNNKVMQGSFVLNLEVYDVPLFSDIIIEIANELKNSNPLYKDIEINY